MKLDELERLEKAATPQPWYQATDDGKPESVVLYDDSFLMECHDGPHDAEFVPAIRNAAPQLIAIARAAKRVAACYWATSVTEAYHHERIGAIVTLRAALEELERGGEPEPK